jgi:xanthine/uracil permease
MIPTHYLHIVLGIMPGVVIGFLIASMLATRKFRRISADEWLAARKFYLWEKNNREL